MDMTGIKTVKDDTTITFDFRGLGAKQGESIDTYLHERVMHLNTTGIGRTDKHVYLLCDSSAQIPNSVERWLASLNAAGQVTEIQRAS